MKGFFFWLKITFITILILVAVVLIMVIGPLLAMIAAVVLSVGFVGFCVYLWFSEHNVEEILPAPDADEEDFFTKP